MKTITLTEDEFTEKTARIIADDLHRSVPAPVTMLETVAFAQLHKELFKDAEEPDTPEVPEPPVDEAPHTMSFSGAIKALKRGMRVARLGWNGKHQYIELASCVSYKKPSGKVYNLNHDAIGNKAIVFYGTSGSQIGWLASQADMLAEDWVIVR